jgi:exopolysaccharide biosynthesis protein
MARRREMVDQLKTWFSQNHTLVVFLGAQLVAMGAAAAWVIAYSVKLETRVMTLETRGAEYSVARMARSEERITVLEQQVNRHTTQLERIVDILTKK